MSTSKISFVSILLLAFFLPLFFLPTVLVPVSIAKTLLLVVVVTVSFGALFVEALRRGEVVLPQQKFFIAALALPIIYVLSGIGSSSPLALFGYGLEVGTAASVILGTLVLFATAYAVRTRTDVTSLIGAFFLSGSVLSVFCLIKIISGGKLLSFGGFSGSIASPIGAWTDYAIFFAVLAIIALAALEMLELKRAFKISAYAVLGVSVILMMVSNFSVAWILLMIFSLVLVVYFATAEKHTEVAPLRRLSSVSLAVFIISLLFSINPVVPGLGELRLFVSNRFNVQNLDVRPSLQATLAVSNPVLRAHPLLGSGPNTFAENWLLYKPANLNSTPFWNTSFPFGVGFLPTQIASAGLLGAIAWAAFLVLLLLLGWRAIAMPMSKRERFLILGTLLPALFLWSSLFAYVPSPVVFYLAFLFTGAFLGALIHIGGMSVKRVLFANRQALNFASVLSIALLSIGIASVALVSIEYSLSVFYYEKALLGGSRGAPTEEVSANIKKALGLSEADLYYRSLSELGFRKAQAVGSGTGTDEEKTAAFQSALSEAITAAQAAVRIHPENYGNWIALGSIYAALVPEPLSVDGAYDNAVKAFEEARTRNPLSPEVPLLLARLDYDHGSVATSREHIAEALALKSDYADAYFLLTQIEVNENDVEKAIVAAKTAALLSPNNAGIFFELGLLEYSSKNYSEAALALAKALDILPAYANAKYFLGLSLDKQGKHPEALVEFEELSKSNPDNPDLPVIIANIKAGRDALAEAPSGTHPEKKPTPPISSRTE